jgi:hypothetical protein
MLHFFNLLGRNQSMVVACASMSFIRFAIRQVRSVTRNKETMMMIHTLTNKIPLQFCIAVSNSVAVKDTSKVGKKKK